MLKLRAVAIVAGIVGVTVGPWMAYDNFASGSWPTVDGVVETSTVTPTRRNWRVELTYSYTVQRPLRGHRYRPGGSLVSSEEKARGIAAAHPPGSHVAVHYDPADPRHSALKTGIEFGDAIPPLLGLLGLAYGLWPRRKKS